MSRLCIMVAMAVMATGLSAGAQTNPADRTSASTEQAKQQKEEGDRRLKAGDVKGAEAAYRKAAQLDPSAYDIYETLGNLLFSNNRYLEAVQAFQKAVQAEPRYVIGLYNIAYAYRKGGKFNEAINFYKKYLEKKPDDPDAYFGLATALEAVGQKQAALDNYLIYIGKETRSSERQYTIKAKDKVEELRKALGLSQPTRPASASAAPAPTFAPAPTPQPKEHPETSRTHSDFILPPPQVSGVSERVVTLMKDGDAAMKEKTYIKAMKAYYDAVQAEPGNPDALYRLGLAYKVNGNSKAAAMKWRQALEADPNYTAAANALAEIEGRPPPAPVSSQPQTAPAPSPAPPTSTASQQVRELINAGGAAFQKNNFYLAITHFLHASQLDPKNEEALFKLGLAYALSKNHQMAIFKWQQVLAINPNHETAKRNIGIAEQNLKGGSYPYEMKPSR